MVIFCSVFFQKYFRPHRDANKRALAVDFKNAIQLLAKGAVFDPNRYFAQYIRM
jgi:hypothetical protein